MSETNPYHIYDDDSCLDTNACTECTGLMYQYPADEEEWESYRDVFDFEAEPEESLS